MCGRTMLYTGLRDLPGWRRWEWGSREDFVMPVKEFPYPAKKSVKIQSTDLTILLLNMVFESKTSDFQFSINRSFFIGGKDNF